MSSEIHLAFAHPSERAIATAEDTPLDRISLRDHIVEVEIGAFQAERGTTQRVCFNVVVEVVPIEGPIEDDVDRILSYDRVTEAIAAELAEERLNLLETLAERIAARILAEPQAMRTFVRIEKLDRGPGALGVEIVRSRATQTLRREEPDASKPHPRVVFLSNDAIEGDGLIRFLDTLEAGDAPAILCVGAHASALPRARHGMPQRRIDLLGIEQNAWVLASRDDRCVVVASRTELDWAMKNGQISVWAPSKLVLDSVHGPKVPPRNGVGLAAWFAGELDAAELVVVGSERPDDTPVPVRTAGLADAAQV